MTTTGQHYHTIHTQLLDLADTLTPDQSTAAVPALPGWSVRDTYAHLAGISADIVAGTVGDLRDTAWTAGHLAARKHLDLEQICAQWAADTPTTMALLDNPANRLAVFAVFDAFHHAHDIRGALGSTEARHTPQAAFVASTMATFRRSTWRTHAHPPIRLTTPTGSWLLGPDDATPTATLETTDFELARILIGRRSRTQMLTAGWNGDPEPIVDLLPAFGPPVTDLTE